MRQILFKNLITCSFILVGIVIGAAAVYFNPGIFNIQATQGQEDGFLSLDQVSEKTIKFINESILQGQGAASIIEAVEENGIYRIKLNIEGDEFDTYVTKDGNLLFPQSIDMAEEEVVKSDNPDVKLFVMSYCPYGLQAEKMYLPVYELLKDKANMEIYFVDYAMHDKQELDENLRQYCIQKSDKEQYYNYLSCFVKDGDSGKCLTQAGIDQSWLDSCIQETDQEYKITEYYNDTSTWMSGVYPQFNIHKELNEQYGVGGSPTMVINDKVVSVSPRSPENFKQIVCEAFNNTPQECSQILSEEIPPSSFGWEGSSNEGSCE